MTRSLILVFLLAVAPGCRVTDAAIATIETQAAGNDRYTVLAQKALDGKSDLATDGVEPLGKNDLDKTPAPVLGLLQRLLESLHVNRKAAHSALFQLNEGPDPAGLDLQPIQLPKSEDDKLLQDD